MAGIGAGRYPWRRRRIEALSLNWFPNLAHDPAPLRLTVFALVMRRRPHLNPDDLEHVVTRQYSDFERASDPNINATTVTQDSLFGESKSAVGRFEADLSHVERAFNEGEAIVPPALDAQGAALTPWRVRLIPTLSACTIVSERSRLKSAPILKGDRLQRVNGDNVSEITQKNMQEKRDYLMFLDEEGAGLSAAHRARYAHAEGAFSSFGHHAGSRRSHGG